MLDARGKDGRIRLRGDRRAGHQAIDPSEAAARRPSPFSGFVNAGFDKRGRDVHPGRAMTTARTRIPALSGLILLLVILILP